MKKIILLIVISLLSINIYSQATCSAAIPFCGNSGTNTLIYANTTNVASQGSPACLGSTPNATWFYFKIDESGPLQFNLIQNTQFNASGDPIGTPLDVDFAVWGPFSSPSGNCGNLDYMVCPDPDCPNNTSNPGYYPVGNLIDCSYDPAPVETVHINSASNGQYYLAIVTNFQNQPGFIKLEIDPISNPFPADPTDCELVCGVTLGNDQMECEGTPVTITANFVSPPTSGTPTYEWLLNGVPQAAYNTPNTQQTIVVNQAGTWTVRAVRPGGCFLVTDSMDLSYLASPTATNDPQPLNLCTSATSGPYVFSPLPIGQYATINQNALMLGALNPADYSFTYYSVQFDADNGTSSNIISAASQANYSINTTTATIWVRIEDNNTGCFLVKSFTLNVFSTPTGTFSYPNTPYCASVTSALPLPVGLTPGGQYVLSPTTPGLVIVDANTGEINPSLSTPGNYIVEYVIPGVGSCLEYRTPANVLINPAPLAPGVTTPVDYCVGDAPALLTATGISLLWYTTSTGGIGSATAPTLSTTSAGITSYFVSQTVGGCEGPRAEIVVNVNAPPLPPSVNSLIDYCQGDTPSQLTVNIGTNLLWYAGPTGGVGSTTAPTPSTTAPGSTTYYVSQTNLGCESGRAAITVNVIMLPTAPVVNTPINYCENTSPVPNLSVTGTNLLWYSSATGGIGSATAPILGSTVGSATYWVSQSASGCEGPRAAIDVNVYATPATPTFTLIQPTCTVSTGTVTVNTPLSANFEYSIDNGVTYQSSPLFTLVAPGNYNIVVRDISTVSQCTSSAVPATINAPLGIPSTPVASVTQQPTCTTPTGVITITSPTGNYEYSIDGGTLYQPGLVFSNLTPNTSYIITVRDITTTCVASGSPILVNPIPSNPTAPVASVTQQPTCTTPTGTITVSAPTGANFEYSINGGTTYQSGVAFSNLTPNTSYSITVRDIPTGCITTGTSILVSPIPNNPPAPTVNVSQQPTCSVITGEVTVSAPTGANYEYSINGGTSYQAGLTFVGLNAGTTYNVTTRDTTTGCVSSATPVTIGPLLNVPSAPVASVTQQPTCTTPTGTITVSGPLGVNYQYSIDGGTTYQAGLTFTSLTPNTSYTITVRDTGSGCIATGTSILVNPLPNNPVAPTASVTYQPTCNIPTGTITVTAPIGAGFEYSINGGTTYQSGVTFANLVPNTSYSITVKDIPTGCITMGATILVNPITANPIVATTTVTQPTCTVFTGTIVVTSPIGAGFEYSINGGTTYQSGVTFANLAPNASYTITVREITTGCVSNTAPIAVDPIPPIPATPTAGGTNACLGDTISLTATSAIAGVTYVWTGPNGFTSNVQNPTIANATAAMAGTYNVIVYQTVDCPSLTASVTIAVNLKPEPILTPGNICVDSAGLPIGNYTIETQLDDTNYTFVWSDANGVIIGATQSFYVTNAPGTYSVVASSNTTPACPSVSTSVTIGTSTPPLSISSIETSEYFSDIKTITVNVLPVGAYEYQLDGGDFQSSNVFTNVSPGPHTIIVRNDCDQLPEQDVYIVDYPRYFTPNADGYHETWNIPVLSGQPNSKILIFDRFGKLLKQIQPSGSGWDGTFNGQALPATDYWFVVSYEEKGISKEFRSHFSIKR